jgi:uncharacterized membrane protein SirB2
VIEFYPQIKHAHIGLALASGAIFALRGASALAGAAWPHHLAVRWVAHGIDIALLTAAFMLLAILPSGLFGNGWLHAKIALLVVYVVLAVLALRRAWPRGRRAVCFVLALAVFAMVYSIARAHHPLGYFLRFT